MTTFYIVAGAMVVLALVLLVPPLMMQRSGNRTDRKSLNVAIFKQRLIELEADLANELIDRDKYTAAKAELERSLLDDTAGEAETRRGGGGWALWVLLVVVPLAAFGLYREVGNPAAINPVAQRTQQMAETEAQHNIQQMIDALVQRLEREPNDAEGWYMLGRTYVAVERPMDAIGAFQQSVDVGGEQPEVLIAMAEAIALSTRGQVVGRAADLLEKALQLSPDNEKGLWLAGIGAYQAGDLPAAVKHWQRLEQRLPAGSQQLQVVQEYISQTRGEIVAAGGSAPEPAQAAPQPVATAKVQVKVALGGAVAGQAKPDDVVYVFARAVEGPRMPLAIVRKTVAELPFTVVLDDTMSMMPQVTLANFDSVEIGARISKSGSATPSPGDLEGVVKPVAVNGDAVEVVINQVRQ